MFPEPSLYTAVNSRCQPLCLLAHKGDWTSTTLDSNSRAARPLQIEREQSRALLS